MYKALKRCLTNIYVSSARTKEIEHKLVLLLDPISIFMLNPTLHKNQSIDVFELYKIVRSIDFDNLITVKCSVRKKWIAVTDQGILFP